VQITSSLSENCVSFHEFFQFKKKRSHLEPGQRIWSQVSSSTGCHPKCRLWTIPSPTVFAIRVRIARQIAGWKTRNDKSSTTVSERWRNHGPSAFQLQVTMLKSDKIWCAYLVGCVRLPTFWTPLVLRQVEKIEEIAHKDDIIEWIPSMELGLRYFELLQTLVCLLLLGDALYCVCIGDPDSVLLQTSKFALASPRWKQARLNWNFYTLYLYTMVSICIRLLFQ